MDIDLMEELQAMKLEDVATRKELLDEGRLYDGYADEMQAVHISNATRLNEIIEQYGWPGESLVGPDGSRAAWFIAQHSICTPELQIKFSREIEQAFESGEVPKKQVILLQDQVLFRQGRAQKCGVVFDWQADGRMGCLVESVEQANRLRDELGLPTFAEALEEQQVYVEEESGAMPGTYEEYRLRADAWRKSVGWL